MMAIFSAFVALTSDWRSGRAEFSLGGGIGMIRRTQQRCALARSNVMLLFSTIGAERKVSASELDGTAPHGGSRRSRLNGLVSLVARRFRT